MKRLVSGLGFLLLLGALTAVALVLCSDGVNGLAPSTLHRLAGAWAFILIGAAYLCFLVLLRRSRPELLKGMALGVGFIFWGGGLLLPPSRWATLLDTAVVLIFVGDLAVVILQGWRRRLEAGPMSEAADPSAASPAPWRAAGVADNPRPEPAQTF